MMIEYIRNNKNAVVRINAQLYNIEEDYYQTTYVTMNNELLGFAFEKRMSQILSMFNAGYDIVLKSDGQKFSWPSKLKEG